MSNMNIFYKKVKKEEEYNIYSRQVGGLADA